MQDKSPAKAKALALRLAQDIGCSGAHKDPKGRWMPCASTEEMERISNVAETSRWRSVVPGAKEAGTKRSVGKNKRKRRSYGWENLTEAPIRGIGSLEGGGIVSSTSFGGKSEQGPCWDGYVQVGMKKNKKGKLVPNCVPAEKKSISGPEFVRDNDVDVFIDPESARARSRQIGCIGISRRVSKSGRTVWMPCTNMTDYSNSTGSTSLGRRNMSKRREQETRNAVRTVLREKPKSSVTRKTSLTRELISK